MGVTVPDEALGAVQVELVKHHHSYVKDACDCGEPDDSGSWHQVRVIMRTAAPLIVAANQPKPDDDLQRRLCEWAHDSCGGYCDGTCAEIAQAMLPGVAAVVAAQTTAAFRRAAAHIRTLGDDVQVSPAWLETWADALGVEGGDHA